MSLTHDLSGGGGRRRQPAVPRIWYPAVAVLACALVGLELDHAPAEGPTTAATPADAPSGSQPICWWHPAAEHYVGVWLAATVRDGDGGVETLHWVQCSNGWTGWRWLAGPQTTESFASPVSRPRSSD